MFSTKFCVIPIFLDWAFLNELLIEIFEQILQKSADV